MIDHKTYQTSTVSVAQNNEAPIAEYFNTYLQLNPAIGYLTFEVFNDSPVRGRVPVPNAKITISKLLGDDYYISKIISTDDDGETKPVPLPTVSREVSMQPGEGRVNTNYNISVEVPGFIRKDIYDVQIFEGITSVQRVPLQQSAPSGSAQAGPARISMG